MACVACGDGGADAPSRVMPEARAPSLSAIVRSFESPWVRAYAAVRFTILRRRFLEEIGQYLPRRGRVLDLGCGFGLFALYFARQAPERQVHALDQDGGRIEAARRSATRLGLANVRFHAGDARDGIDGAPFDAAYLVDLVHHLPRASVPAFLARVRDLLAPDGTLVVKDVSDRPAPKRLFTLALDRVMVGLEEPIHYWPPAALQAELEALGFDVKRHDMRDVLPYPHVLYVCRRVAAGPDRSAAA